MRTVTSLLLASAAGLAVTAGAQAADLPVKAKPVEYVKVCSLYGAGFYYIPGTDTCIRVGGHIRAEAHINGTNNFGHPYANNGDGLATDTRDQNRYQFRSRAYLYNDTRTQTAYGTLRTYTHIRMEVTSPNGTGSASTSPTLEAALIQWGGFTAGRAQNSFMHSPYQSYKYANLGAPGITDTPSGRYVFGYTHQFGNGLSGTIALEDPKGSTKRAIYNGALALSQGVFSPGTNVQGGNTFPDIVGQIRLNQAWGGMFLAGVITNNHVAYDCGASGAGCTNLSSAVADKVGGAVNVGFKFNMPTGKGDAIYMNAGYSVGATSHVFSNAVNGNGFGHYSGNTVPTVGNSLTIGTQTFGYIFDSVYSTAPGQVTGQQLTTAYGGNLAFEHYWNPQWRTSVFGGAMYLDYNNTANAILCSKFAVGGGGPGTLSNVGAGCDMDFRVIQVGSRTVWEPVKDLLIGVEVQYSNLASKNDGAVFTQSAVNNFRPAGRYLLQDQDIISGIFSVRRFF